MHKKELVHSDSTLQALVVQKMDSAVHQINHYPVDNATGFLYTYPLNGAIHQINRYPVDTYQGNQLHLLLSVVYALKDHRNDIKMLPQVPLGENGYLVQGCAIRKIEGTPVLCTCKIQDAQHVICMKNMRFSQSPKSKSQAPGATGLCQSTAVQWKNKLRPLLTTTFSDL